MKKVIFVLAAALSATPVQATTPAQLTQARTYVESIYREVTSDSGPPFFDFRSVRYAPQLRGLIARDYARMRASGDVVIDYVPFCECQDIVQRRDVTVRSVTAIGPSGANVSVVIRRGRKSDLFEIKLLLIGNRWYVSDVLMPSQGSLVAFLQRGLKRQEKRRRG